MCRQCCFFLDAHPKSNVGHGQPFWLSTVPVFPLVPTLVLTSCLTWTSRYDWRIVWAIYNGGAAQCWTKQWHARSPSTQYCRHCFEGYLTKVDWSVVVCIIKNKKATETQELDRFGPSARCNTLLLWSIGLYWLSYDIVCVLRGPLPALYSWGVGLQVSYI